MLLAQNAPILLFLQIIVSNRGMRKHRFPSVWIMGAYVTTGKREIASKIIKWTILKREIASILVKMDNRKEKLFIN